MIFSGNMAPSLPRGSLRISSPGQSRGFGFVEEMSSDAEAQAAITALNGTEMGGRTLTVR